jgi:hypothetical protein
MHVREVRTINGGRGAANVLPAKERATRGKSTRRNNMMDRRKAKRERCAALRKDVVRLQRVSRYQIDKTSNGKERRSIQRNQETRSPIAHSRELYMLWPMVDTALALFPSRFGCGCNMILMGTNAQLMKHLA